jgi:hypothetical protein
LDNHNANFYGKIQEDAKRIEFRVHDKNTKFFDSVYEEIGVKFGISPYYVTLQTGTWINNTSIEL